MSSVSKALWTVLVLAITAGVVVFTWETADRGTLIAMAVTVVFAIASLWTRSMAMAVLTLVAFVVALAMMLLGWAWDLGWWMAPLLVLVWAVAGRQLRSQSM